MKIDGAVAADPVDATDAAKRYDAASIGVIVRTAVRAVFLAFVICALGLGIFVLCAPYAAMRFYLDCGNDARALECADNYINLHKGSPHPYDSRYAGVLYTAAGLAMRAADCGDKRAAGQANDYIRVYLSVDGIAYRNAQIDAYNLTHSSPALHPALYSVRAYLENAAFRCRLQVGKQDEPMLGFDTETSRAILAAPIADNIETVCVLLKNLTSYCAAGFDITTGTYAGLYADVKAAFPVIRDYVVDIPQGVAMDVLRHCYYTGTVSAFMECMYETADAAEWAHMDVMGDMTVGDYYQKVLMPAYLAFYE